MWAWQVGDVGGAAHLKRSDVPIPPVGPRDVMVRTAAVALNYRDGLVVNGRYSRQLATGAVPCSDAAGEVVAIGPEVSRVRVGERVTSIFAPAWHRGPFTREAMKSALGSGSTPGVLAEFFVLPEDAVMPMPDYLSYEEAATLPCAGLTAFHALFEECLADERSQIVTMGTGGVSVFALQIAAHAGMRVMSTSGRTDRLARLRQLGADATLNYRDTPEWGEAARTWSGGEGADNVIEVGGEATLPQSLRAVRPGGMISLIGNLSGAPAAPLMTVLMRNVRLQGVMVGSRDMYERMLAAFVRWHLHPVVDRVWRFEDAPKAFDYLASGQHFGKVVMAD